MQQEKKSNINVDTTGVTMPGVMGSIQKGEMPSNEQINEALENARRILQEQRMQNVQLDERGHQIAMALEKILGTSQGMIQDKNWDEGMQRFAEHVVDFGKKVAERAKSQQGDLKASLDRLGNLATNLRSLLTQLFTSTKSRSMMMEAVSLFDTYLSKKQNELSEEFKREFASRVRNLLIRIGEKKAFKETRADVLAIYDYMNDDVKEGIAKELQDDFKNLYNEALGLVQRFAPNNKVEEMDRKFWQMKEDIAKDQEAKQFFADFRKWADSIVNNPEKGNDEGTVEEGKKLIDRSLQIREKYGEKMKCYFNDIKGILKSLQGQEHFSQFGDQLKDVRRSLTNTSVLGVVSQLRQLAIPIFKDMFKEIPLPKMEEKDNNSYWCIDNMVLSGRELSIDDISFNLKFGMKDMLRAVLKIKNLDITIRNIHFKYERTSMPSWSDEGILNCTITIPYWKLRWFVREKQGEAPSFVMSGFGGGIRKMSLDIVEAKHNLMDKILLPMWTPSIRHRAQEAIERTLRGQSNTLTEQFNKFFASNKGGSFFGLGGGDNKQKDQSSTQQQQQQQQPTASKTAELTQMASVSGVGSGEKPVRPATSTTSQGTH